MKRGLGPTGVVRAQAGPWTGGVLANHAWWIAGCSSRPNISTSFVQPFASEPTATAWRVVLPAEASRDWKRSDASVPLTLLVGKVLRLGGLRVQVSGGPRNFAGHIDNGPPGCGARLTLTKMFAR